MRETTFVRLGLLCFGLVLATFLLRGTTRIVFGDRVALAVVAPFALAATALLLVLFVVSVLAVTNVRPLRTDGDES